MQRKRGEMAKQGGFLRRDVESYKTIVTSLGLSNRVLKFVFFSVVVDIQDRFSLLTLGHTRRGVGGDCHHPKVFLIIFLRR